MAIVFDTTVGGASSTSFVTVAEFNTYVENLISDDVPSSDQTTLIQKLLNAATEVIDSLDYVGGITNSTQNLQFPRTGMADRNGYAIDGDTIPTELKNATCEMAIWLFRNGVDNAQNDSWDNEPESASIGGALSMSYKSSKKPSTVIPERVKFLLNRMGTAFVSKVNRARRS